MYGKLKLTIDDDRLFYTIYIVNSQNHCGEL